VKKKSQNEEPFRFYWSRGACAWCEGPFEEFDLPESRTYQEPAIVLVTDEQQIYRPPDGLYLKFAQLDPEADSEFLGFAQSYGLLGAGPKLNIPPQAGGTPNVLGEIEGEPVRGEPRSYWRTHVRDMRVAVNLWDAIKEEDDLRQSGELTFSSLTKLGNLIQRSGAGIAYKGGVDGHPAIIASPDYRPQLHKRLLAADLTIAARTHLQELVNTRLRQLVSWQLMWVEDLKKLTALVTPNSLIGHMWRQLATAIDGLSSFRNCVFCGQLMVIAPESKQQSGLRNHRVTCSDSCRSQKYQARQKALRLRKEGLSLNNIAVRLGIEAARLKEWLQPDATISSRRRSKPANKGRSALA
jgi:hypothetical protein